jgi:hypothetical protein
MSIHQEGVLSRKRVASLGAWLVVSGMFLLPGYGIAQIVTLSDNGSAATVDLGSSAGMDNWSVLGQNQLMQQWFWYQTDGGVAKPINTIGNLYYQVTGNNTLDAIYQNSQLSIEVVYQLTGGGVGSGNADMMEDIYAKNLSGSQFTLNLFEYSNFNLLQSGNNSVTIIGSPGSGYNFVQQSSGSTAIQEAITSPNANYAEAGVLGGFDTLYHINNTAGYNLNGTTAAGPGNVSWAFQWAQAIDPGKELDVFKDKSLSIAMVPEPGTTALAVLGGLCLTGWTVRRRHSAS